MNGLAKATAARQQQWDPDGRLSLSFRGNEMAGEVGEACNVIKKLERARLNIAGSRDTVAHLAEELADVIITAYATAYAAGIDLDAAVVAKVNVTSRQHGFPGTIRPSRCAVETGGHRHPDHRGGARQGTRLVRHPAHKPATWRDVPDATHAA